MLTLMPLSQTPSEVPLAKLERLRELQLQVAQQRDHKFTAIRQKYLSDHPTPTDLAAHFDPNYVRTPALELIGQRLVETISTYDGRLVLSIPPQEGKSSNLRVACAWLLIRNPDWRIVYTSYAASLARASGRIVRSYIQTHGEQLGLTVARDHADASDWQLDGHRGGMVTTGVGGSLTGKPADCLFIDDPLRNRQDADSDTVRSNLHDWWSAVARTRLAPGAPVVIVQTRWVEDDLAGRMEAEGWPTINIPALADGKTPDALNRAVGEWLVSARGRTPQDWERTRHDVGERDFAALYQGRPAPLEGGIFKVDWFNTWRVPAAPVGCLPPTVVVDPADNEGDGDEAGIVLATTDPVSGKVYILDDLSAAMTVARWARAALLTCARRGAPTLAFERSLSQLPARIREAWQRLHQQAVALHKTRGDLSGALARLVRPDDPAEARDLIEADLVEIVGDVEGIVRFGETGPRLRAIVAKGSKQLRMQLVAPMFETGRAVMVGTHSQLEYQACLPAGTLIETISGPVPIQDVSINDLVATRSGYREVTWSGLTGQRQCWFVETNHGRLEATPDHRIWVIGVGWVEVQNLQPGDVLVSCPGQSPDHLSNTTAASTGKTMIGTLSTVRTRVRRRDYFTATYGLTLTVRSLLGGMFTIGTTIQRITSHLISKLCQRESIVDYTGLEAGPQCHPNNGNNLRASPGLTGIPEMSHALTAKLYSSQLGNAQNIAMLDAESTTRGPESVNSREHDTLLKNAGLNTRVRSVGLVNNRKVPVFDLTVSEEHEFFANGVLVHNSLWQPGQDSPDRVDAMTHACSLLSGQGGSSLERATERIPTSSASLRNRSSRDRITRSVRR